MREVVLFDREKALLPATQHIAAERAERDTIVDEIREVDKQIAELKRRKVELERRVYTFENKAPTNAKQNFVRACPSEECRGFLSSDWNCGLCSKKACKECHQIMDDVSTHVCNADDVATAKLLDKDTKPCPKCSTGIFKIAGCDQMWCTQCHTAFDWKTGRLETAVHNPHYFEYLRRTNDTGAPRNQLDHYVCGETIDSQLVRSITSKLTRANDMGLQSTRVSQAIESTLHLRDVQLPKYRTDQAENNLELRVQYLRGQITETDFKVKVQRANKAFEKKREIFQVSDLLQRTVTEILLRMETDMRAYEPKQLTRVIVNPYLNEIYGIIDYVNECLQDISKTYGSKKLIVMFYESAKGNKCKTNQWTRDVLMTKVDT